MNVTGLLMALVATKAQQMTREERIAVVAMANKLTSALLSGDRALVEIIVDALDIDQRMRDVLLTWFLNDANQVE